MSLFQKRFGTEPLDIVRRAKVKYGPDFWNQSFIEKKSHIDLMRETKLAQDVLKKVCKYHGFSWQSFYKTLPKIEDILTRNQIIELLKQGESIKSLAKRTNIDKTSIFFSFKRLGIFNEIVYYELGEDGEKIPLASMSLANRKKCKEKKQ